MPASSLELYNLTSPICVSYRDGFMVIAEYYLNQETGDEYNRISIYNPLLNEKKLDEVIGVLIGVADKLSTGT